MASQIAPVGNVDKASVLQQSRHGSGLIEPVLQQQPASR